MYKCRPVGEEEVIQRNMALAEERHYTTDFLEALPEDERAELIDGQLFYMAPPTITHQRLQLFLAVKITNHIWETKCTCQAFVAPVAVFLNRDNKTWMEPDVIMVCDDSKLDEKGCHGAPDFVAEIVSPSTRSRDYLLKMNKYQNAGVREYWILDKEREVIQVYDFEHGEVHSYGFQDQVQVRCMEGLTIDFSQLR